MNENIDLTKILKDCPKGTTLYSIAYGNVRFEKIIPQAKQHPIIVRVDEYVTESFSVDGKMYFGYDGECALFPSREQRDWSKFTAPLADEHPADVWHEAKEKPRVKEWILVQFSGGDYEALALDELGVETWSDWWCDNYKVIRWAYISDLMPKGGEE